MIKNKNFFIAAVFSFFLSSFISCIDEENYLVTTDTIQLFIVSGNNQTAKTGEFLPEDIIMRLGLSSGVGLADKIISVSVVEGNGDVINSSDTTDENGLIHIKWKLGYNSGTQQLTASTQGVDPVNISASAVAFPGTIEIISGSNQSAFGGDTLLNNIVVAVKDSSGNPVKDRLVKSELLNGGQLIPNEIETDDNGIAEFKWITGDQEGEQKINFSAGTSNTIQANVSVLQRPADREIIIFDNSLIKYPQSQTIFEIVALPETEYYSVEAVLELNSPCINCSDANCDPWDRIGFVTIDARTPGGGTIPLELIRFITPYGNSNTYVQDVSQFASLLTGNLKFNGYISTFLGQWNITFKLRFKKATLNNSYYLASPIIFDNAMFATEEVQAVNIDVPENNEVLLTYFTTGHNNQGRNCDEFCQKLNRIYVDDNLVYEFTPWREDCRDLVLNKCGNPGSVILDRAGWCPGFIVEPHVINIGKLPAGRHLFKIHVVDIEDNGGYWRTSLSVVAKK